MGKIRGTHSSPGVYTQINDISYAVNSLGITTGALVGETKEGPAFEPIFVTNGDEFESYFGGTSPEKFKDSQYPKYELPYIAKSFLKASDQLYVCRVLGLSGYNAGKAFVITASNGEGGDRYVVAVLRSRGEYRKYQNLGTDCKPVETYDTINFFCDSVELEPYTTLSMIINECEDTVSTSTNTVEGYPINGVNFGQFTIVCKDREGNEIGRYPVSLNAGAKDYIYNVIGGKADEGNAAVFVEELYDLMLSDLIGANKATQIDDEVVEYDNVVYSAVAEPVRDFVTIPQSSLTKKHLAQTFIYSEAAAGEAVDSALTEGGIYIVTSKRNALTGKKSYVYEPLLDENDEPIVASGKVTGETDTKILCVKVLSVDAFAFVGEDGVELANDMSDYREQFRCGMTPWIVSELKGTDAKDIEVKKLFRFYTITDGNSANEKVKISIENIRPDEGKFDVLVREFGDSDGAPVVLESYKELTMVPGTPNYIGLKIGTVDGAYEARSKYVMVEVIENDMTETCVPAGFLGYPTRYYGDNIIAPTFSYNTIYDEDIKDKKQYFGLSDLKGIDVDMLSYKGKNAYSEDYSVGYTNAFHLDCTLNPVILQSISGVTVTVDGEPVNGWTTVSPNNVTIEGNAPRFGSEDEMEGTIYENVKLRKFTVCFFGGFDGWDIYRNSRTNTNEYKANKYKGAIKNGLGAAFSRIQNGDSLNLKGAAITSDYYAYLAGIKQFEQPERFAFNILATPGIDYVNNTSLVSEVFDMIEDVRKDSVYLVTTPDKPWGASDAVDEMYTSQEAADNLADSGIDSFYGATYYPWVKFYDKDNNIYINLPATKDVMRNMADVDNKKFPWYAPAGFERGKVECVKTHFFTHIEDEDNVYNERINAVKTFSKDGVKIWGNKSMYECEDTNPMNRINNVRLLLYLRKIIIEATNPIIFEEDDKTMANSYDGMLRKILNDIKDNRGITNYKLLVTQTPEQMDAHEMSVKLGVKPTPTLEYVEIEFNVTPQGIEFNF